MKRDSTEPSNTAGGLLLSNGEETGEMGKRKI